MKVLIIEDESRAAHRLEKLLLKLSPKAEIVAKIESVREGIRYLENSSQPDLIFADIQLGDGLSFEIFKKVRIHCPIIFTTAYDQYAIEAFNTNGIDYLLKPIEEERLEKALQKLDQLTGQPDIDSLVELLSKKNPTGKKFKSRFMVKVGEQIKTVPTEEIRAFYSFDRATFLLTKHNNNYIIDYTLDQLEDMLDPEHFFRVNRKHVVSLDSCNRMYAWSNSRLKIEIDGLDDEVIVARDRVGRFKEWLDG